MAQQTISLGTVANDGLGDTLRDAGGKINANFTELYTDWATKAYVDAAVTGLLDFKGATDCSANPNYPAASKGDAYVVSVAGKIGGASGASVDVGDVYLAKADNAGGTQASVGTSWTVLEHNLVGALLAANNLSDLASPATARTNLGVAIGTNVQAWDADLDAVAALTGTNTIYYRSAANTWTAVTIGGLLSFSAGTLNVATGTSGSVIPLLSGANTWGGVQTFPDGEIIGGTGTDAAAKLLIRGTARGLRLGTDASQSRIDGTDQTGSGSYQNLFINGAQLTFGISNVVTATLSSAGWSVTGAVVASTYLKSTAKLVSALTAAATAGAGARDFVTDATSATFGAAVTGGGSNKVPVWSDGTGWFIG